jgi:hypothetical protein
MQSCLRGRNRGWLPVQKAVQACAIRPFPWLCMNRIAGEGLFATTARESKDQIRMIITSVDLMSAATVSPSFKRIS